MKKNKLLAYILTTTFLLLTAVSFNSFAMSLQNGGVVAGEIAFSGEVDSYTFNASAGNTVYIRAADTETTEFADARFSPRIELVNPNGTVLTAASGGLVGDIRQQLVTSGEYTVRVLDSSTGGAATGSYNLYFAGVPGANDDGQLVNGEKVSGQIDLGDIDSYTFTANAGETVYLRVADTETTEFIPSPFFPSIQLLGPSGNIITSSSGALVGDIRTSLTQSGTYTVIIVDESTGEDAIGSYDLYLAKAPGANDDGRLANGRMTSGEIDLGDIDSYTFTANAGETVYLRVADTDGTEFITSPFFPSIQLLGPSGSLIASSSGALVGDIRNTLSQSGTYTVIIVDESTGDDAVGTYDLFFAKAPGANNNGRLANDSKVSGEITLGDIDSYSFTANAGETVYLRVADTETTEFVSSPFFPSIELLGPSGNLIASSSGALVGDISRSLTQTGTYTVIIVDESTGEDANGSYDLYYAKAPGANSEGCVANGESQFGFIDLGDIDSFGFHADAGTSLLVTVTDLDDGGFSPFVALLGPSGNVITSRFSSTTAQINQTLSVTGNYTLIIADESTGEDATGNYRIEVLGTSVSCPPPITPIVEVSVVHSCIGNTGRFDVNVVNTETAQSVYTFNLEGQSPRTRTVQFENWGRMPITGRPAGTYSVEVLRDGNQIYSDSIEINCAASTPPVSSPEITIVNACVSGNGFVLFQMVNPTSSSRPYVIEFDNVPNRSTTAQAYGQTVRGTSGRPDGIYEYSVRTGSTVLERGSVEVDCD